MAACPARLADLVETSAQGTLVDALIRARLLVSDEDTAGHFVVRVAHEALLSRWPRARDIVNANRDFLETRARVQTDARRWQADRRNPELLLPPGKRLGEAEELLLTGSRWASDGRCRREAGDVQDAETASKQQLMLGVDQPS